MNPRTTVVLFAVALLLGAFVYFYEIRGGEQRKEAELTASKLFPGIEADGVDRISLVTSDDVAARVERRDGLWRVIEPVDFPGDAVSLDGISSTLAQLSSEGAIDQPQSADIYGLGEQVQEFRFAVGDVEHTLRIGDKTPVGANTYVATSESDKVFMLPSWRVNSLRKSLDDLRDRRPIHFDRNSITRLHARWPGGGVVVEKRDDVWWIVDPIEGRADASTLETLLSDLSFLRADGFVDDPPPDAETGLDRPEFAVELETDSADQETPLHLAMGAVLDGKVRLVRGAQSALYRVAEQRLGDFPRALLTYRFKELASFVESEAASFELAFDDPAHESLEIRGQRSDQGWESSPEAMAADKAADMLAELSRLKAIDILADFMGEAELRALGLAPPHVKLRVFGAADEGAEPPLLAEVHLGQVDPERGIVAKTPDRPTVYRIPHSLAEHLPVSVEAFRNRFLFEEPASPESEAARGDEELTDPTLNPLEGLEGAP